MNTVIGLKNLQLSPENTGVIAVPFNDTQTNIDTIIDIAEIRVDQFTSFTPDYVSQTLAKFANIPNIITIRSQQEDENSLWTKDEKTRLTLFEHIISKHDFVDAVDIELSAKDIVTTVIELAHANQKIAITSFHDFAKTPDFKTLESIIIQGKQLGADVVKIAVNINSNQDIKTLELLLKTHKDKGLIVIGMGQKGARTRLEFVHLGSLLTFACHPDYATAPGQITYQEIYKKLKQT